VVRGKAIVVDGEQLEHRVAVRLGYEVFDRASLSATKYGRVAVATAM
jgi:hypothetical protein